MAHGKKIIVTSFLVTGGVGYMAGVQRGEDLPTARFILGMGVAFTFISIIHDLGSPLAGAFAVLIMVAAILAQGDDLIDYIAKRTKATKPLKPSTRKRNKGRKTRKNLITPESIEPPPTSGGGGGGAW